MLGRSGPFRMLAIGSVLLLAAAAAWWWTVPAPQLYRVFDRPDGAYRVVVMRQPQRLAMAPGQSSDAPGTVQLQDRAGRILATAPVSMVQLVEEVDWTDEHAAIRFVADWDLRALSKP